MTYPLEGVQVLDLSRVLAGPFAGRMLSDLGADVVKLEPPQEDLTRLWGAVIGGVPGYFHQQNAGKRDVCIDLSVPEGVALAQQLAAKADIVIENFRPGVMDRLRCYVLERERDVLTQQLAAYNTTTHSGNGIYVDNTETVEVNS